MTRRTMLYDVNTIANYDPDIVPLLDTPFPVAFARDDEGRFVQQSRVGMKQSPAM